MALVTILAGIIATLGYTETIPNQGKQPLIVSQESTAEQLKPTSPLRNQQFQLPTAEHLNRGDFILKVGARVFFFQGAIEDEETVIYSYAGLSWGISDRTELTFISQLTDSGSLGNQGDFRVTSRGNEGNFFDLTLELKQRLYISNNEKFKLSGIVSASWGQRGYTFRQDGVTIEQGVYESIVPALALPLTMSLSEDIRFTISPTIAFFSENHALYLHTPPIDNPGSFGTTFGLTTAISYAVSDRFTLWGDAFFPLTGNNSISRESGRPAKAIAYNLGVRYLVNPQVGLDVFASNTYGITAPMALTADRSYMAIGANLVFLPDFIPANRSYRESQPDPGTIDGLAFFDGGTTPTGSFLFHLQGGSNGIMTALRYGIVRDVEVGAYLDYVFSNVDESEQGISAKVRLLNQAEGEPLTMSVVATLGQTNQPFVNFFNDNRDTFNNRNLDREIPMFFRADNLFEGRLYITTISLPLHYQFDNGGALWLTPIWGYVQRSGTEAAGFNLGGATPVFANFSVIGEVGANFTGEGNAIIGNRRTDAIPWTAALRWYPLGLESDTPLQLELYLTNRLGSSPWQQLRVREQNDTAIGIGLSVPFSF